MDVGLDTNMATNENIHFQTKEKGMPKNEIYNLKRLKSLLHTVSLSLDKVQSICENLETMPAIKQTKI